MADVFDSRKGQEFSVENPSKVWITWKQVKVAVVAQGTTDLKDIDIKVFLNPKKLKRCYDRGYRRVEWWAKDCASVLTLSTREASLYLGVSAKETVIRRLLKKPVMLYIDTFRVGVFEFSGWKPEGLEE